MHIINAWSHWAVSELYLWQLIHQVIESFIDLTQQSLSRQTHVLKKQLCCILHKHTHCISHNDFPKQISFSLSHKLMKGTWALRPIFSSLRPLLKPLVPLSTRKRLMPWAAVFASRFVTATTITTSLIQPLVINTWRRNMGFFCATQMKIKAIISCWKNLTQLSFISYIFCTYLPCGWHFTLIG